MSAARVWGRTLATACIAIITNESETMNEQTKDSHPKATRAMVAVPFVQTAK